MRYLTAVAALGLLLAVTGTAGATTLATNTANNVTLDAAISDSTPFDALQPNTDYTVDITCSHDITYFGYESDGTGGGFSLDPNGDVVFTSLPTYGTSNFGYGPWEYSIPTPTLSGNGKELSGISVEVWDPYCGEVFSAGDPIMSLALRTGGLGSSTLGIGEDTAVDWTPPGSYPIPCFDSKTPIDLKVVPEPVTMAGLVLGIGGLVGYIRRRR